MPIVWRCWRFGSDSLVEMLSATVVLLQFLPRFPLKKMYADRAAAALLFALAAVVCASHGWGAGGRWRRVVWESV